MKENSYHITMNLKNSIKAIEKMNREIEHHPENKVLLNKAVEGLIEKNSIKDFKKVFYKRGTIENSFPEKEELVSAISYDTGFSYYFAYMGKGKYFEQADYLSTALNDSKESDFIKFVGFNVKGELILFIVNNKVLLTKEEKKVLKKFFE